MPYAPLRRTIMPLGRVFGAPGWWLSGGISASACVAAYAAKGAASQAASYTNLANPGTYDLTLGVAPTWATGTGWTFNGSSQYLKTGIIPASGYTLIVRYANADRVVDSVVAGEYTLNARIDIWPWSSTNHCVYEYGTGAAAGSAARAASGVAAVAGPTGYLNGTLDKSSIGSWTGTATNDIHIARLNRSDAGAWWWYKGDVLALAIYNTTLDAATIATLTTAMNGL